MKHFRNKTEIKNIEPHSLWKLSDDGTKLILVDDDQYIAVNYQESKTHFYQVEL